MTEKLYYSQPYAQEFEAEITAVSQDLQMVALDRSLFFAGGGGQPCDLGHLTVEGEEYEVVEMLTSDGQVWHKLARPLPTLEMQGREVRGVLDWERRYAHMRHHSALHVLNGVAYRAFGALVAGAQVYSDRARIDLTLDDLSQERVEFLERESNAVIGQNIPMAPLFVTPEEAASLPELVRTFNTMPPQSAKMRVMEIVGLDRQFCGGTHVASIGELGPLKVLGTRSKGKNNKRIEIGLD